MPSILNKQMQVSELRWIYDIEKCSTHTQLAQQQGSRTASSNRHHVQRYCTQSISQRRCCTRIFSGRTDLPRHPRTLDLPLFIGLMTLFHARLYPFCALDIHFMHFLWPREFSHYSGPTVQYSTEYSSYSVEDHFNKGRSW
jgi:hypothetical protein